MPPDATPVRERSLTYDQLRLSPYNVRINEDDATRNRILEESIRKAGVRVRLWVHPLEGEKNCYGVLAGGRRMRSVGALIERGEMPADYAVPVKVYDLPEVELIALSLDENFERRDLRFYEVVSAVYREHQLGRSIAQLADRHNQSTQWTERAVRLGGLARPIFDAFADDRITLDQAKAFGATGDHELQLAAFEALMRGPAHARTEAAIRAWLRIDDREAGKLLRFVGEEAYFAAGGGFDLDLFADGADRSGRVTDEPLLRRLADGKVEALRATTRERVARPELRFAPQAPRNPEYGGQDSALYVQPSGAAGNELPDGDIIAVITIPDSGEAEVAFWWASRKALQASTKAPRAAAPVKAAGRTLPNGAALGHQDPLDGHRQKADAAIKEEAGLTREGIEIARSLRRAILRAALVQDAREGRALGADYLVWAQARMILSRAGRYGHAEHQTDLGMRALAATDRDGDAAAAQIEATEAGKTWAKAIAELQREPFLTEPDLARAFLEYRRALAATRDLAAAIVAGVALERSLDADGYRVPVHDALASEAHAVSPQALRHWWQPSAAFLDMLPTAERRAIVEPFVDDKTYAAWAKYKSAELTPLVLRVVQGTAPVIRTQTLKLAAAQWVHPLVRFRINAGVRPAAPADADVDAAELEGAEA